MRGLGCSWSQPATELAESVAETTSTFPDVNFEEVADDVTRIKYSWTCMEARTVPQVRVPDPRSGHAAFRIYESDPRFFVHGGANESTSFDDLYCYHSVLQKWTRCDLWCPPAPRSHHTACVVSPDESMPLHKRIPRLLLFGGFFAGSASRDAALVVRHWRLIALGDIACRGLLPPRTHERTDLRRPPRSVTEEGKKNGFCTNLWEKHDAVGDVPISRCNHTLTEVGAKYAFLIFGWNGAYVNHVYRLDTLTNEWSIFRCKFPAEWEDKPPLPRAGHSATLVGGRYIVVFGGQNADGVLGELLVLDTKNREWVHPKVRGRQPRARSGHTATFLRDLQCIVVYGGFTGKKGEEAISDEVSVLLTRGEPGGSTGWKWVSCARMSDDVDVEGPGARVGHSAVGIDGKLFIFGGQQQQQSNVEGGAGRDVRYTNDVFELTLDIPVHMMPEVESAKLEALKVRRNTLLKLPDAQAVGQRPETTQDDEESSSRPALSAYGKQFVRQISQVERNFESLRYRKDIKKRVSVLEASFDAKFAERAMSGAEVEHMLEVRVAKAMEVLSERRKMNETAALAIESRRMMEDDLQLEECGSEKATDEALSRDGIGNADAITEDGDPEEGSDANDIDDDEDLSALQQTMEEKLARIGPSLAAAIAAENERLAAVRRKFDVSASLIATGSEFYGAPPAHGRRDGARSRPRRVASRAFAARLGDDRHVEFVAHASGAGRGRGFTLEKDESGSDFFTTTEEAPESQHANSTMVKPSASQTQASSLRAYTEQDKQ